MIHSFIKLNALLLRSNFKLSPGYHLEHVVTLMFRVQDVQSGTRAELRGIEAKNYFAFTERRRVRQKVALFLQCTELINI